MKSKLNRIHRQDCIEGMRRLPDGCIDLAFADPPFNIGYEYDVYDDRKAVDEYLDWSREWTSEVIRVLKPTGTFWLAIGDEFAAELKVMFTRELGLTCRSWVVWYYTFGVNCKYKFSRSHAHLFYFVKDRKNFTFNADDPHIRVPSARQLVYGDKRANPKGRLPDDTWILPPEFSPESRVQSPEVRGQKPQVRNQNTFSREPQASAPPESPNTQSSAPTIRHATPEGWILRPQDVPESFQAHEDTWYFARVAGTFNERAGWHGCQMPEQLLGRIIRACSNLDEIVLDPFTGSGTTLAVAKKLGRRFLGYELSPEYAARAQQRIQSAKKGHPLTGPPNPLTSAPSTGAGKGLQGASEFQSEQRKLSQRKRRDHKKDKSGRDPNAAIVEGFARVHNGFSADYVIANPELNAAFIEACWRLGMDASAAAINRLLLRTRKKGQLKSNAWRRVHVSKQHMDQYIFASEIATRKMADHGHSLDDVLCNPELATTFDAIASDFAPGFTAFEYRWGALHVRKTYHCRKSTIGALDRRLKRRKGTRLRSVFDLDFRDVDSKPGIYRIDDGSGAELYIGETENLCEHLNLQFRSETIDAWKALGQNIYVRCISVEKHQAFALKGFWVIKNRPVLNYLTEQDASTAVVIDYRFLFASGG